MYVKGVEEVVEPDRVERDRLPDLGADRRRVAGPRAAVDALEVRPQPGDRRRERVHEEHFLDVWRGLALLPDHDRSEEAARRVDRRVRAVVVVRPDPDG